MFPTRIAVDPYWLRHYEAADAQPLWRMVDENRYQLLQNFAPLVLGVNSAEAAASYIAERDRLRDRNRWFTFGIWNDGAGDLVGQLAVKNVEWTVPSAELSYFVARHAQRRGIATAAIRTILSEAFSRLGFKRIHVRIVKSNLESASLATKVGFRFEGTRRQSFRCGHNELHDVLHFAMTDGDYAKQTLNTLSRAEVGPQHP